MSRSLVFISYSHEDRKLKDELIKYLRVYEKHRNNLALWSDSDISVGDDWLPKIEHAIENAAVAILLITVNFLTSDFIQKKEIPQLLERRLNNGLVIIPIIARECPWDAISWLSQIQAKPLGGRAIWSGDERSIATDLTDIAKATNKIISRLEEEAKNNRINRVSKSGLLRILVADDHVIAVEGICSIIQETEDMEVVATAQTKLDVLKLAEQEHPDVIILDLDWHHDQQAGDELIVQLRTLCPKIKIAAVTQYEELMESARRYGAFPIVLPQVEMEL
jgi:CheY-like chemotaxis protein